MITPDRLAGAFASIAAGFGADLFDDALEATLELERYAAGFVPELDELYERDLDAATLERVRLVLMNAAGPFVAIAILMTRTLADGTGREPLDVLRAIEKTIDEPA